MVRKPTPYEDLDSKFKELNLTWSVSKGQYVGMNGSSKADFRCVIHDVSMPNSIIRSIYTGKKMCKGCRALKDPIDKQLLFRSKGVEMIEKKKDSIGRFKCLNNPDHEEWDEKYQQVMDRSFGCYPCNGKERPIVQPISKEEVIAKMHELEFQIIGDFKNTSSRARFKCKHDHEWETHVSNVFREKSGCPKCSIYRTTSVGEATAIFIIQKYLGKQFERTRKVLPSKLELDGFNEELKLAIEYNGVQHYSENKHFFHKNGAGFEAQLERDAKKQQECDEAEINLIVVSYELKTFDAIRAYIESELESFDYEFEADLDWDELKNEFNDNYKTIVDSFEQIKKIAEGKGGVCVSDKFDNVLTFKCKVEEHPKFEKSVADVRRGVWCNCCAHNAPQSTNRINEELRPYKLSLYLNYKPGAHVIQTFICDEGHIFERTLDNLRREPKYNCAKCSNLVWYIPIYKYTTKNTFVVAYDTLADVPNGSTAKSVNESSYRGAVKNCVLNKSKTAGGFIWSFIAPIDNKLMRYRNTRESYSESDLKLIDYYGLEISPPVKTGANNTATTGATKAKNRPVLKYDLDANKILARFDNAKAAGASIDDPGIKNKMGVVYNSCCKFAKGKVYGKCTNRQIFMYEDDNCIIP